MERVIHLHDSVSQPGRQIPGGATARYANYDPIPGAGVSGTDVGGRRRHDLRGSVVCGPAPCEDCLVYIQDWQAARGGRP